MKNKPRTLLVVYFVVIGFLELSSALGGYTVTYTPTSYAENSIILFALGVLVYVYYPMEK